MIVRLSSLLDRVVGWLVTIVFSWMILLSAAQLIARWLHVNTPLWLDPNLRYSVLWLALLGGALAASRDRHIKIDIAEHNLPKTVSNLLCRSLNAVAFIVCVWLFVHSMLFIFGEGTSGNAGASSILPAWAPHLILPIGFLVIAAATLLSALSPPKENQE